MGRETIADIITLIRNAGFLWIKTEQFEEHRIISITENIVKILEKVLLKTFGNIRKVKNFSWFQPCSWCSN